jgi:hypothetical protein
MYDLLSDTVRQCIIVTGWVFLLWVVGMVIMRVLFPDRRQ